MGENEQREGGTEGEMYSPLFAELAATGMSV